MWKIKGILVLLAIIPFVFLGGGTLHAATGNGEGYFFIDSNEPGGPAFVFEDISGTGVSTSLGDEDSLNVAMGFNFVLDGTTFTDAVISSNGHIDFTDVPVVDGFDCNNSFNSQNRGIPSIKPCTPSLDEFWGADPLLAVWFSDLDPTSSPPNTDVYYETKGVAPDRRFIVQWEAPPFNNSLSGCGNPEDMLSMQAIVFEGTDEILYQYADATTSPTCFDRDSGDSAAQPESMGGSATVGLSFASDKGLEYSSNEQLLADGLAIMFGQGEVNLTVDTDSIDFGNVQAGSVANTSVIVTNAGASPLTITGIGVDDPLAAPYSILSENCVGITNTILPSGSCAIVVEYDPTTATAAGGSMFASVGTAGGLFLFGIVAGGTRNRRILAALIVAALLMTGMFLASCGSSNSGSGPTTVAFPDSFDIDSNDAVRPEVTVSVNGTTRR
jgi:hypothetical protein